VNNVVSLISSGNEQEIQAVLDCYERSVKKIDIEESNKIEQTLKNSKSAFLNHSPVYILGESLKAKAGAKVTYSNSQTAITQLTLLHLTTNFGDNCKNGFYQVDDSAYSYKYIYRNDKTMNDFVSTFKKDMA
jgi:hypothetical protein